MPLYLPRKVAAQPQGGYRASRNPSVPLLTDLYDTTNLRFEQRRYGSWPTALPTQMSIETRSFGRVAKFNAGHTGVSLGSSSNYTSTTQSWLIVTDLVPGYSNGAWVFGKASSTFSNSGFWTYVLPGGQIRFATKNATSVQSEISSTKSYSGFTAIVISVSPTTMRMAVNGEMVSGSTVSSFAVTTGNAMSVAKSFDSFWDLYLGGVYLIAGWDGYLLSEAESYQLSLNPWQIFAPSTFVVPVSATASYTYSRPSSDVTTQWTPSTPGAAHYTMINETTYNDANYIYATAVAQTDEVGLQAMTAPQAGTSVLVNYRVQGIVGSGSVTVSLYSGATLVKTDTTRTADNTSPPYYTMTVTSAEWGAVSVNWSDMRLRFVSA